MSRYSSSFVAEWFSVYYRKACASVYFNSKAKSTEWDDDHIDMRYLLLE